MVEADILKSKKLFVFDMDGTIYLGERVFPEARDFLLALRKSGRKILFFTNNASRDNGFYMERLSRMGFEPRPEEIMSSGDVTKRFLLSHRANKRVYLVGTERLMRDFTEAGIPLADVGEDAEIVVSSFDTELTYAKLSNACRLIFGGAEYLSTHPDFNCPTENGFIPDSGAIAAFITASTGVKPRYFGKPYSDTLDMIVESKGVDKSEICVFGDRLYTDIALGTQNGVTSCLVMTGETTAEALSAAPPEYKPTFVFENMSEPHKLII